MAKYTYRVRNQSGEIVEGILEAAEENQAQQFLQSHQFEILNLKTFKEKKTLGQMFSGLEKINVIQFNFFVRQMATLLKAGVPLLTGLETLQEGVKDPLLKRTIGELNTDVSSGSSFSQAVMRHPKVFSPLFVATIKSGEAIGELDTILLRLAEILEKDYKTQQKVKAAMRYPMLAFGVLIVAFLIATLFIIPRFESLFTSVGAELPLPTKLLMGLSYFMKHYWYICIALIAGIVTVVVFHYRTSSGRRFWDGLMLRVHIIGEFMRNVVFSRFSRMLGLMLKSGVNILQGLELIADIVDNSVVSDAILRMKTAVEQGDHLSNQMKQEKLFPVLMVQIVNVGEESGRMDDLLIQISEFYDAELEVMTKNMETLIEPVFIMILAVFVTIMALGIFLPMWNLYGAIQNSAMR